MGNPGPLPVATVQPVVAGRKDFCHDQHHLVRRRYLRSCGEPMNRTPPSLVPYLDQLPEAKRVASNDCRSASIIAAAISEASLSKTEVSNILNAIYHRFPKEPEFESVSMDMEDLIAEFDKALNACERRWPQSSFDDDAPYEKHVQGLVDGDLETQIAIGNGTYKP
jgi:hypothetical protein